MKTYTRRAPAKINIGLRVLSKRNDGYHNIETIFYPVKIHDRIKLTIAKTNAKNETSIVKVSVKDDSGIKIGELNDTDNICHKAALYFLKEFKTSGAYRIDIRIVKKIPVGAGLGGGSSDAAAVLRILTGHFRLSGKYFRRRLMKLALKIGSDVPFFLSPKPSYATSRGEKILPLDKFHISEKILIVNPGIHISSSWAYDGLRMNSGKSVLKKKFAGIKSFDSANSIKLYNDFEKVVFRKYPATGIIKIKMYEFNAMFSSMSGSGSTVYGFFKKEADLKSAQKHFRKKNYKTFTS